MYIDICIAGDVWYTKLLSYVGTDLAIVCYSVTSPQSLQDVGEKWIPEIRRYSSTLPFILVGLKVDERFDHQKASSTSRTSTERRSSFKKCGRQYGKPWWGQDAMLQEHIEEVQIVDKKLAKKVAKVQGAAAHMECSAKTNHCVDVLFENTVPRVLDEHLLKRKKKSSLVKKIGKLLHSHDSDKKDEDANIRTQSQYQKQWRVKIRNWQI